MTHLSCDICGDDIRITEAVRDRPFPDICDEKLLRNGALVGMAMGTGEVWCAACAEEN